MTTRSSAQPRPARGPALLIIGAAGVGLPLLLLLVSSDMLPLLLLVGLAALPLAWVLREQMGVVTLVLMSGSLIASSRLRPAGVPFREGGAELALAPLDLIFLVLLTVWWGVALATRRLPRVRWRSVDVAIGLFVLTHLLATLTAQLPIISLLELLRLLKMVLLVWALRITIDTPRKLEWSVVALAGGVLFVSLLALAEWSLRRTFGLGFLGERDQFWVATLGVGDNAIGRVGATLGHPNALSSFLVLLLPLFLMLFLLPAGRWRVPLGALTLGCGGIGLILTFSRAGWLSVAAACGLLLLLYPFYFGLRRQWIVVSGTVGLAGVVAVVLFSDLILLRLLGTSSNSELLRIELAKVALNMFRERPLLGVGLNSFVDLMPAYDTVGISRVVRTPVHNLFLLYLAEGGLLTLGSLLGLFGMLYTLPARGLRYIRRHQPTVDAALVHLVGIHLGVTAGLVAILIQGSLDWLFRYDPIYLLFWFMAGLSLAATRLVEQQATEAVTHAA